MVKEVQDKLLESKATKVNSGQKEKGEVTVNSPIAPLAGKTKKRRHGFGTAEREVSLDGQTNGNKRGRK